MKFAQTLGSLAGADGTWHASIDASWLQGRSMFGGLQAALALRAMRAQLGSAGATIPLRVMQITFIAPLGEGPLTITTQVLRRGKSSIHMQANLLTPTGDCGCLVVGIFGQARESVIRLAPPYPSVRTSVADTPVVPYDTQRWPAFAQHIEFRWAAGGAPFSARAKAHSQIYVRLRDDSPVAEEQVVALADAIPSPGLAMLTRLAPSSSLTWTLELLTTDYDHDSGKPWLMDAEVTAGRDGYLNQSATLFDPAGKAVALARQSVVVFG